MQVEHTVEFKVNINNSSPTVIIPTCGLGSRMGDYTNDFNKALLPYKHKPVLSHIIDNFPADSKFIVPVGYMAQQIKDFCTIAYSDRDITFVDIDDYTSPLSGTAYTLKQCRHLITSPFWYVPCDTYFEQSITNSPQVDCYFVKDVPSAESHLYTMFNVDTNVITDIKFKQPVTDENYKAFTGLMYINDYEAWYNTLDLLDSTEFIYNIPIGSRVEYLDSWLDFGSVEVYEQSVASSQKFDFSKKDEITYNTNNRIVKYWTDTSIPLKKHLRIEYNPSVYPGNVSHCGNFMGYDYHDGITLYQANDITHFNSLLDWLQTYVWKTVDVDITSQCNEFYKTKSLSRIEKYLELYPNSSSIVKVDGVSVSDYKVYLEKIDWDYLTTNTKSVYIHGDLQFDNIIIDDNKNFKLIDWRHEFSGLTNAGDIYYDLAKLYGGTIINYAMVKNNQFGITFNGDEVTLDIPNVDNIDEYRIQLKNWIISNNLDWYKVELLVPLIYWNMSPLHTDPFNEFLWYLGLKLFAELYS